MGFKNLNLRSIILIIAACLFFVVTIIVRMIPHATGGEQEGAFETSLDNKTINPAVEQNQILPAVPASNPLPVREFTQDDSQSMKEMKEQMDQDRLQQKKIKMLKLQLEQTNLQLEQEKALSEISKLEKENTSIVNDSNEGPQDKYPEIKVIYIGGTADNKQAILSINGSNYSVKEKNTPVKNVEIVSITDTTVTVHFDLPQDLTTAIDYKPE